MKKRSVSIVKGDKALWIILLMLCVISILVVYSSTVSMAYKDVQGDTSYYVIRQLRFLLIGLFATLVIHWIPSKFYLRLIWLWFTLSVILCFFALFYGEELNDAQRWLRIPFTSLTFSPSEALKIALVMVLAVQLGKRQDVIDRIPVLPDLSPRKWRENRQKNIDILRYSTKPIILPIVISVLVVMPPNLSTALMIAFIALLMLMVGRVQRSQIWKLFWISIVAIVVIIGTMNYLGVGRAKTWVNRVENFISPIFGAQSADDNSKNADDEFQKQQAKIAVASGGVIGKGPGNSTQRSQLPHPYSDFAYAFIVEEYGIFGGVLILVLYLWIFYRAGIIMRRTQNYTKLLLVFGLSITILVQAFINVGVSVGLMPITGQTLPIISLGGSSVLFTCIAFGIMLGISRENNQTIIAAIKQQRLEDQNKDEQTHTQQQITSQTTHRVEPNVENAKSHSAVFDNAAKTNSIPVDESEDSPFIVVEGEKLDNDNKEKEIFHLD